MTYRKKLIEVALPLEAINIASAREKSIRHGRQSTHQRWRVRRPLVAAQAVTLPHDGQERAYLPRRRSDLPLEIG